MTADVSAESRFQNRAMKDLIDLNVLYGDWNKASPGNYNKLSMTIAKTGKSIFIVATTYSELTAICMQFKEMQNEYYSAHTCEF